MTLERTPGSGPADELTNQGAAALRAGDSAAARALLVAAIGADPQHARAWLWLSGAVATAGEQRYCLERAATLDPSLAAAQRGLAALAGVAAIRPGLLAAPTAPSQQPPQPAASSSASAGAPPQAGQAQAATRSPTVVAPAPPPSPQARPAPGLAARSPSTLPPAAQPPPRPATGGRNERAAPPSTKRYHNPWLWIWSRPRLALRSAVRVRSDLETILLGGLAGTSAVLSWASLRGLGAEASPAALLLLALLAGPPFGLVALLLLAVPLRGAGAWIGGRGSSPALRAALAWSGAPLAAALPLWVALLALAPGPGFGGQGDSGGPALAAALRALQGGLWAWAALLAVLGVGEAHRVGPLRAALAWLVAALLVVAGGVTVLAGAGLIIQLRQRGM